MATPEQIDLVESEVARLLEVALKQGVNSWELLGVLLRACEILYLRAGAEYQIKGGQ